MVLGRFLKDHLVSGCWRNGVSCGCTGPTRPFIWLLPLVLPSSKKPDLPVVSCLEILYIKSFSIRANLLPSFLLAVVLVHFGHVATYHFHNRMAPRRCFLTYQTYDRFDASYITTNQGVLHSYKSHPSLFPFENLFLPWKGHKIESWFQSTINDWLQ